MGLNNRLQIGDVSNNGQVEIVDEDRLCYLVRSTSKGATGLRTISKSLLEEYVNYWSEHSDATSESARQALSGTSEIDKFEYGYTSTLSVMAQMVLQSTHKVKNNVSSLPRQQIFYGAPGTGKSCSIKKALTDNNVPNENIFRTTFHPDSDYSTFVGAYKPTMEVVPHYESSTGAQIEEKRIAYNFIPQAFLNAYVRAYQTDENVYLVIEEINRGNCAQIFGDLFQLLDRGDDGKSDYSIKADTDIRTYLEGVLGDDNEGIKGGNLSLPANLYILATMNTSDQSLFPIDSAFKRRWEWEYVPIRNEGKGWVIAADGKEWDWWQFLNAVNEKIASITDSEDKKLGYYFVKPADGHTITAKTFVGKVLFYLWNDVFKDYGFSDDEFQTKEGKEIRYPMFYETAVAGQEVNEGLIAQFLNKLLPKPEETDEATNTTTQEEA
nr:AAA family ATPase [uncultured Prevotella sp.]